VKQFFDIFQQWSKKLVELALEVDVDFVQYRGWYETPTYWGVKGFKEFLAPLVDEQAKMVHAAGKLHGYFLPSGHGRLRGSLGRHGKRRSDGPRPENVAEGGFGVTCSPNSATRKSFGVEWMRK